MAKKITISGSNLLSSLSDAWGGSNSGSSPITVHGTGIPAGAEWGMNRGEVERFIKAQLAILGTKIGCPYIPNAKQGDGFYHLWGFADSSSRDLYLSDSTTYASLLLCDISIPISMELTFVGTYNSLAELQAVQNPTNNDYGFVIETDAQGNEYYDRYKYVASSQQWLFEYKVEITPFTDDQWAAIQSGITSALVTKLNALPDTAIQSVTVGETTTGAAGSNASVTNSGTATAPVLNFTIPQGAKGDTGDTGATGPAGATGTTFTPSVDSSGNLSWTNDGGKTNPATVNIKGAKGDKGDTGAQGPAGDTVIIGGESTYTLYGDTGQNTNGAMTQKAVTDKLTELSGDVIEGDYIQGDEISLNSILPGYIKTDGTYRAQSGFSTNTYRVDNLEKIMVEVQPFTEPPVSISWFFYVFWSDSQAVTPTMARTAYANNSKFVLDVPQGSKYFGIMTVVNVNNVTYGNTSNVSVYKCESLKTDVEKIQNDLYSSSTTDFPAILNYSAIKNGYPNRDTGNFVSYSSSAIQTAFYDVSRASSIRVNCDTPAAAPYCAFYGVDGVTALNGKLDYYNGAEFIVPRGAVFFALLFRFNDNLNIDTFVVSANINAGLINQVEALNEIAELYKSLFDWSSFTWLLVGDSLTESNFRAETQYYEWIDKKTNITWINKGQSGKGYANGDYFYSVFNSLTESFSFATIFGSGNDIRYESFPTLSSYSTWDEALGDIDDNGTTSICGYINRALDKFYEVSPLKKIGLITPTPWKNGSANNVTLTDEETRYRMKTYSEKLVLIAKKRGIPCLDLFNSSGLRPWNEDFRVEYYNENGVQDGGVHPNSKGHKWISNMFLNFIFQYLVE